MTERPILFSAPMVRALLAGRKTQTRRVVKLPKKGEYVRPDMGGWTACTIGGDGSRERQGREGPAQACVWNQTTGTTVACPYGVPGDRLWVKETWADVNLMGGPGIAYRANGDVYDLMKEEDFLDERGAFNYDHPLLSFGQKGLRFCVWSSDLIGGVEGSWRSPLHMPRWASRLTLRISEIRAERLQDISDIDAVEEGVEQVGGQWGVAGIPTKPKATPEGAYRELWEHINGPGSWAANPWVWVVSFQVEPRHV